MLRVNEKSLRKSLADLKQCEQELYNRIEQLDETRCALSRNSALEEEMVKLGRILDRAEIIQHNIKSMTRVLDYAVIEYGQSENDIVSQCAQTLIEDRNSFRFGKVVFNVPFSDRIGWKKGV